jgi:hypothetical protein
MTEPQGKLVGWLRAKLDQLDAPEPPAPEEPGLEELAADVIRLGWGEPAPDPVDDPAASTKRMTFIVEYVRNPAGNPSFANAPLVYGILAKEQVYQRRLAARLATELAALPPPGEAMGLTPEEIEADPHFRDMEERRAGLTKRHADASAVQARLFRMMKGLVGKAGLGTGGTGPLAPPPGADSSLDDALLHIDAVLQRRGT